MAMKNSNAFYTFSVLSNEVMKPSKLKLLHPRNPCKNMCRRCGEVAFRRNKCKKDSTGAFI